MNRLDVSPWNLGLPLTMVVACGPIVPIDGGTDTATDPSHADPSSPTEPYDETTPQPTTGYGCEGGCPTGFYCVGNQCQPEPYDESDYCVDGGCCYYDTDGCCYGGGEFGGCCYGDTDCGYNNCFSLADCTYAGGYCADFNSCQPAATPPVCDAPIAFVQQLLPALPDGAVLSLSFVETDGDPARELAVGTNAGAGITSSDAMAATPLVLPDGVGALDIGGGDLDGDGDVDLVVATSGGQLAVLSNDGLGAFAPGPIDDTSAQRIEAADVDGDGLVDLVGLLDLGSPTPQLAIMRAMGGGEFEAPYVHAPLGPTYDFEVGELFGDEGVELVAFDGDYTTVWRGGPLDGSSDFILSIPTGQPGALALGDFDGNGFGDAVQVVPFNGQTFITVWQNHGDGFEHTTTQGLWGSYDRAEAADLDLDGRSDLVVTGTDGTFVVLQGTDSGSSFGCSTTYDGAVGGSSVLALGDYDGDGGIDVAISDGSTTVVHVRAP